MVIQFFSIFDLVYLRQKNASFGCACPEKDCICRRIDPVNVRWDALKLDFIFLEGGF